MATAQPGNRAGRQLPQSRYRYRFLLCLKLLALYISDGGERSRRAACEALLLKRDEAAGSESPGPAFEDPDKLCPNGVRKAIDRQDIDALKELLGKTKRWTDCVVPKFHIRTYERTLLTVNGTALHYAASTTNQKDVVTSFLVSEGFHPNVQTRKGRFAALHVAARNGNVEVIQALASAPNVQVDLYDEGGLTPLMYACKFNRRSAVDALLNKFPGIQVDLTRKDDYTGYTALIIASKFDQPKIVEKLLVAGSDVNFQNKKDGFSALIVAASWGHDKVVKELLTHKATLFDLQDKEGKTALAWAANSGAVKAVRTILASKPRPDINLKDKENQTALMLASDSGEFEVVEELAQQADIEIDARDKDGCTALIRACRHNNFEVVNSLLQRKTGKADITASCQDGRNAVMTAAFHGRAMAFDQLRSDSTVGDFERAAFDEVDEDGNNALGLASQAGKSFLLPKFFSIRTTHLGKNKAGETPFFVAAKHGQLEMVRKFSKLLPASSWDDELHSLNNIGDNALMGAIASGQEEMTRFFLKRNMFDLNCRNKANWTLLHHAVSASSQKLPLVKLVLQQEPELSGELSGELLGAETTDHKTALQMAVELEKRRVDLVEYLLNKGASPSRASRQGNSALKTALGKGDYILTHLLVDAHASLETDLDDEDVEAHRLAVWMGVSYLETDLVFYYAVTTDRYTFTEMSKPPTEFFGDLAYYKAVNYLDLLSRPSSLDMVHLLLQWIQRDRNLRELNPNNAPEVGKALTAALKTCHWLCANSLAARGFATKEFEVVEPDKDDLRCQKDLAADSKYAEFKKRLKDLHWNRLHFTAASCDTVATTITFSTLGGDELAKLLSEGDGNGQTPFALAKEKKSECPGNYATIKRIQDDLEMKAMHQAIAASAAWFVSSSTLFLNTCILRLDTLRQKGWCNTSVIPLLHILAGACLAHFYRHARIDLGGQSSAVSAIGLVTAGSGAILLLLLTAVVFSDRFAAGLRWIRKCGTDRLERCWHKLDFGIAVALSLAIIIKDLMIGSYAVGLSLGIVHAVACYFPLRRAAPRNTPTMLRLLAGSIALGAVLVSYCTGSTLPPPATLLLGEMCLGLAWADMPGLVRKVRTVVEIELTAGPAVSHQAGGKFCTNKLVLGKAVVAAHGLEWTLGLTPDAIAEGLRDPIAAMKYEIWNHGNESDRENFRYIVDGTSGNIFDFPSEVLTALETGRYHGGPLGHDDFDTGHGGRTLDDWMKVPEVVVSNLTKGEFVAVRFYTSSSYRGINGPLRNEVQPHPWAMVVYLLDRGIKKLRSVQAEVNPHEFACKTTLWRGLKNLEVDIQELKEVGGTEVAPMSTSTSEEVARSYSASKAPVLFKFVVNGLRTGVSIQFLSLFPKEEEFLYAPLTFLSLKRFYEDDGTIVLVMEPVMS